jgi:hypothetical protein
MATPGITVAGSYQNRFTSKFIAERFPDSAGGSFKAFIGNCHRTFRTLQPDLWSLAGIYDTCFDTA